jgi:hypothetical protein
MLRLLIRLAGVVFLGGGFVALVVDGARSLAGGSFYIITLASMLQGANPSARADFDASFGSIASGALFYLLAWIPLSVAFCVAGGALFVASHKERAEVGPLAE